MLHPGSWQDTGCILVVGTHLHPGSWQDTGCILAVGTHLHPGSWHTPSGWCFGFLNVLLKSVLPSRMVHPCKPHHGGTFLENVERGRSIILINGFGFSNSP